MRGGDAILIVSIPLPTAQMHKGDRGSIAQIASNNFIAEGRMNSSQSPHEERSRSRPMHVAFDYFRRTSQQPCISLIEQPNNLGPIPDLQRSFSDQDNNIVLLCAFLYVNRAIARGLATKLIEEIKKEIGPDCPGLNNIPQHYREHYHWETVVATLMNGMVRMEKVARTSFHELRAIQSEFVSTANMYPFFRFCLVVWLRLKAVKEFTEASVDEYLDSTGNEVTVLLNYQAQLRGLPLDILCNVLCLRLCLRTERIDEYYGGRKSKLDTERELHCFSLTKNSVLLQVDEQAQFLCGKMEMSASGVSTHIKSNKLSWTCWDKSLSAQSSLKSIHINPSTPSKPVSSNPNCNRGECRVCGYKECSCNRSIVDLLSPKSNHQNDRRQPMFFHSNKALGNLADWSKLNRRILPQ